ncbi:hypothetical protein A3I48_01705 [Candidatus Daviesbacteria bacterium RIFCSPLOWO2_02_FULL_36_7]|uniref:Peptidase M11 gametolysin domain-containing protein n=1 Tax=Candidatus Daviesbacteria bacterium RIFCSPLOWO2_02_FULL_36_7 TaxID=1797792 RepID=A0A1F5MHX6_9BACT|nr:MAG: hypothetical protein A3I48_01705 [Candidatus Daviesbacteria bacterium RIFCSPLOWO2_02_FULL_36_7]
MREKGFAHILILLLLLAGLVAGVYLVTSGNPLKLFSKASESDVQSKLINDLTSQLIQKRDEYNNLTKPGQVNVQAQKEVIDNLTAVAIRRKEELSKLIEQNPQAFLDTAKLADQKDTFPKQVQEYLEEKRQLNGKLDVLHRDDFKNKISQNGYVLDVDGKKFSLYFTSTPPTTSISQIKIEGVGLDFQVVIAGQKGMEDQPFRSQTITPPAVIGDKPVMIFLVHVGRDTREPISQDQLQNLMFGATNSVNSYYQENSYNQLSFSGSIHGWYTTPEPTSTDCLVRYTTMADDIDSQARQAGLDVDSYVYRIYVVASSSSCDHGAQGTIGGNPSRTWVFDNYQETRTYSHELGHGLGLDHANSLMCGTKSVGRYWNRRYGLWESNPECAVSEYGDNYDIMGDFYPVGSNAFHFNAPHKVALGWIPASRVQTVSRAGTYTINSILETSNAGTQILKIAKPDKDNFYYLSYRQPVGLDSGLPVGITLGLDIHIWDGDPSHNTKLVDTHVETANNFTDASLSDNSTFYDQINGITVRQVSHNSTSAQVEVSFGSVTLPPVPSPNTITVQTTCASPHDRYNDNHLDVDISGRVLPINSDTIWLSITDEQSHNTAYVMTTSGTPGVFTNIGIGSAMHAMVQPIRGPQIPLTPDGRTFTVKAVSAPYTSGTPDNPNILAQTSFSKLCFANPSPSSSPSSQSISLSAGNNLIGLTVDKGSGYKAANLASDLNSAQAGTVTQISKWYAGSWQTYIVNFTANNFFDIKAGEGYLIKASRYAQVDLSGAKATLATLTIKPGYNSISFPEVSTSINTAEKLVNEMKNQGINITTISRWKDGRWNSYIPGFPAGSFNLQEGEGYYLKSSTNEYKTFNIATSAPSSASGLTVQVEKPSFSCTSCIADINKDKNVNISDISLWAACRVRGINSSSRCLNADLDQDGQVGNEGELKCLTSQFGKKC